MDPWNGLVKKNARNHWFLIFGREVATTLHCSDGKGEDFTLSRIEVLALVEQYILQADGFRLTSQDVVEKEVTIKRGSRTCMA